MTFAESQYAQGLSKEQIMFIELMCSSSSELIREKDFEQRLNKACLRAGVKQTILQDERVKRGIFEYISYFQNFNKGQLLFGYQLNLWRVQKLLLDDISENSEAGATEEELTKRDKMMKLATSWEESIERLYRELYGHKEFVDISKEEVRMVLTPEQRIKKKKQA